MIFLKFLWAYWAKEFPKTYHGHEEEETSYSSPLPNPSVIETYLDYSSQDPSFKVLALDLDEFW